MFHELHNTIHITNMTDTQTTDRRRGLTNAATFWSIIPTQHVQSQISPTANQLETGALHLSCSYHAQRGGEAELI